MSPHMHARRVEIAEPRLSLLGLALHEVERARQKFLVDCLHPFGAQWAGIFNHLLANAPEGFIDRVVVLVSRTTFQHPARAKLLAKVWVLWIVRVLRLLLSVQMIEVAEELVETLHRRQVLVA